jgi:hypothetical protein
MHRHVQALFYNETIEKIHHYVAEPTQQAYSNVLVGMHRNSIVKLLI